MRRSEVRILSGPPFNKRDKKQKAGSESDRLSAFGRPQFARSPEDSNARSAAGNAIGVSRGKARRKRGLDRSPAPELRSGCEKREGAESSRVRHFEIKKPASLSLPLYRGGLFLFHDRAPERIRRGIAMGRAERCFARQGANPCRKRRTFPAGSA